MFNEINHLDHYNIGGNGQGSEKRMDSLLFFFFPFLSSPKCHLINEMDIWLSIGALIEIEPSCYFRANSLVQW